MCATFCDKTARTVLPFGLFLRFLACKMRTSKLQWRYAVQLGELADIVADVVKARGQRRIGDGAGGREQNFLGAFDAMLDEITHRGLADH